MDGKRDLVLIAALGLNREIGVKGGMPWRIPSDMKRFRLLTRGHSVIMGRLTFVSILEALRKPLPKRQNIVITRGDFSYPGVTVARSMQEAVELAELPGEVFVAGGGQIYELALPLAAEMWLTHVTGYFPEADTFLPNWHVNSGWLVEDKEQKKEPKDSHETVFRIWTRT